MGVIRKDDAPADVGRTLKRPTRTSKHVMARREDRRESVKSLDMVGLSACAGIVVKHAGTK
jgi:hypothetical protein